MRSSKFTIAIPAFSAGGIHDGLLLFYVVFDVKYSALYGGPLAVTHNPILAAVFDVKYH